MLKIFIIITNKEEKREQKNNEILENINAKKK